MGRELRFDFSVESLITAAGVAEKRRAFADTMRLLHTRIGLFVSLPLQSLDEMSLQNRLGAIGRAS